LETVDIVFGVVSVVLLFFAFKFLENCIN
jgi:hypothetical protein